MVEFFFNYIIWDLLKLAGKVAASIQIFIIFFTALAISYLTSLMVCAPIKLIYVDEELFMLVIFLVTSSSVSCFILNVYCLFFIDFQRLLR